MNSNLAFVGPLMSCILPRFYYKCHGECSDGKCLTRNIIVNNMVTVVINFSFAFIYTLYVSLMCDRNYKGLFK